MPLQISVRNALPHTISADVLVIGVFARPAEVATGPAKKRVRSSFGPAFTEVDRVLKGALGRAAAKDEFTGKRDQTLSLTTNGALRPARVVILGLGDATSVGDAEIRAFAAKASRAANADKAGSLALGIPELIDARLRAVGEGLELGAYRFTKYLTGDRKPKADLTKVTVVSQTRFTPEGKRLLALGSTIGIAVNRSRDLGNEPSNVMTPEALASAAAGLAREVGLKAKVFDFKEIVRRGMKLTQAVGQGSVNEPRFVHLTYAPAKKAKKRLVFVGKGITFDSGGLSIKPAAGMGEMKADMSGAGNMVGLMAAVAALQPAVEVHAILTCAENMPDGNAYRPGDVWGSLDGKTVEIINTDAEGRLLLADALAYARDLAPDLLVDNATLTGACVVALGNTCSGWYATSDDAATQFGAAVRASGETMWRMPLLDDLREQIKSDIADVKQTGERYGGSITAALFLREFIGTTKNWVHVDIAGPALADRVLGWSPKGATGHGILTFLALIEAAATS